MKKQQRLMEMNELLLFATVDYVMGWLIFLKMKWKKF